LTELLGDGTCFSDGLDVRFQSLLKLEEAFILKIWLWNSRLQSDISYSHDYLVFHILC